MQTFLCFAILVGIVAAKPGGYRKEEVTFSSSSSSYKNGQLQHEDKDEGFYKKHEDLSKRTSPIVDSQVEQSKYRNPGVFHSNRLIGQDAESYINQRVHGFGQDHGIGQLGIDHISQGQHGIQEVGHGQSSYQGETAGMRSLSQGSIHSGSVRPVYTETTPEKYSSSSSSYKYSERQSGQYGQTPTSTVVRTPIAITPVVSEDDHQYAEKSSSVAQSAYVQRPVVGSETYGAAGSLRTHTIPLSSNVNHERETHQGSTSVSRGTVYRPAPTNYATADDQLRRTETQQTDSVHQRYSHQNPTGTPIVSQSLVTDDISAEDIHQTSNQHVDSSHVYPSRTVYVIPSTIEESSLSSARHSEQSHGSTSQHGYAQHRDYSNSGTTYRPSVYVSKEPRITEDDAQVTEHRRESSRTEHRTITKPITTTTMHVIRPTSADTIYSSGRVSQVYPSQDAYPTVKDQEHIATSSGHGSSYYVQRPVITYTRPAYKVNGITESRYVQTSNTGVEGSSPDTMGHYPNLPIHSNANLRQLSSSSLVGSATGETRYPTSSYSNGQQYSSSYSIPSSNLRTYQTYTKPSTSYESKQYYQSSSSHSGHGHTGDDAEDCVQSDDPSVYQEHNYDLPQEYAKFAKYGFGKTYDGETQSRTQRGYGYGSRSQYGGYGGSHASSSLHHKHDDLTQQTQDQKFVFGEQQPHHSYGNRHEDLTQQTQDHGFGTLEFGGQQREDLTQQTQDIGFGKLELGGQQHEDLTQQTQDDGFGKLEFGGQQQEDLTQQTQDEGFGKLEFGGQQQEDLTQQTQDEAFGKLELGGQQHEDLTQYTQDEGFGKLEFGGQQREDVTQQTQDDGFGKLEFGGQQREDLTQQTQNIGFGKLELDGQHQEDLTQQTQDSEFGKLEFGGQQREDLTQQTEDEDFGKLEFGGQQHEDLTQQKPKYLNKVTQYTQDSVFGEFEFGSQQNEKQYGSNNKLTLNVAKPTVIVQPKPDSPRKPSTVRPVVGTQYSDVKLEHSGNPDDLSQQTVDVFGTTQITQNKADDNIEKKAEDILKVIQSDKQLPVQLLQQIEILKSKLEKYNKVVIKQETLEINRHHASTHETHHSYTQQQRHDKLIFDQQHDDLTQQTQDQDFDKLFEENPNAYTTGGSYGKFDIANQQSERHTTQHSSHDEQTKDNLDQKFQHLFESAKAGQKIPDDLLVYIQNIDKQLKEYEKSQLKPKTPTRQPYGKLDFMDMNGQKQVDLMDMEGQTQVDLMDIGGQMQEDLTQQSQDKYGKLDFGGQQQEDLTQQSQDNFDKLQFGGQEREDLTQQTQDNIGKLEFGAQLVSDVMQQTQDSDFGKLEFGGQEKEDITQQTQDNFGELQFGGQQQEDLTQQTQDIFGGQRQDDLTQITTNANDDEPITETDSATLRLNQYNRQRQQAQSGQLGGSPYVAGGGHYGGRPYSSTYGSQQSNVPSTYAQNNPQTYGYNSQQTVPQVAEINKEPEDSPQSHGYGQTITANKDDKSSEEQKPIKDKESVESQESKESDENVTTTVKPGFWKRVGGKIKDTYGSAKESAKVLVGKVQSSVG